MGAATAAPPRQTPTESELLSFFAAHEELEEELAQEWLAGALGPLNALHPRRRRRRTLGVRGRAHRREHIHGRRTTPRSGPGQAPRPGRKALRSRVSAREFIRSAGAEGDRGIQHRAHSDKGEAPPSKAPPELQAPIRSAAAARCRTGEWDGPGGWREAPEGEIGRAFVHFGITKVIPARTRSEAVKMHGRGRFHTPHLVVPFKEKRNSDGEVTRNKARNTAADLVWQTSRGRLRSSSRSSS